MAKLLCECGCGGAISAEAQTRGWRYVRGHKPRPGGEVPERNVTPPKVKKETVRKTAPPAPVWDGKVTMSVSEQFLQNAWVKLPLELKAIAIAAALEA
jgi:hypothetical protein